MYYHASRVPGIKRLIPHTSNHGRPLLYLSAKRENVLVYLSNAVEKYCRESGFVHNGIYRTWASYGFTRDKILRLDEYYPDAIADTYRGVSGFIYTTDDVTDCQRQEDIPYAVVTEEPAVVNGCEYVPDAYDAIIEAAGNNLIAIRRYETLGFGMQKWIEETVRNEYLSSEAHPEYRAFLKAKFAFL